VIFQSEIRIDTSGRGTYDFTREVREAVRESGVTMGLCHLFIRHTSASMMLCENADPSVRRDLETFMARQVPDGDPMFTHRAEGPDDMPAHVRSILTQSDLNIPVRDGHCALGTWQGVYLWEHRTAPHGRRVIVTVQGD
jgi:secondary thiamine-phosphate synthase enzyme